MQTENDRAVAIWDPLVRICHWLLVATFFVAYFTDDDLLSVHVWAGYTVGGVVVLRVLWGFVGSRHARFSDFVFGPWKVWTYLLSLIRFRAERHMGHSPAGGMMAVVLLIGLAVTVWSGLEVYAIEENAGPLAGALIVVSAKADTSPSPPIRLASDGREHEEEETEGAKRQSRGGVEDEFWEEVHEIAANAMLALVIVHMLGVGFTSVVHRENLVRAMITGKKREA
jgi:cytochrome b